MEYAWWFMRDEGAILEADYPNLSQTSGAEYNCTFDPNKVVGHARTWGTVTGSSATIDMTKISEVKAKLAE